MKRIITIHFYLFILLNLSSQESTYKFIGVGDMMLGTNYPSDSYIPPKGTRLLKNVEEILKSADVTFGNLEGTVLNSGGNVKRCSDPSLCYAFRQPDSLVDQLLDAGFDLLSIANNHVGDFGSSGRTHTVEVLRNKGFCFAGLESIPWDTTTINNLKIGFCAFSPNNGTVRITDLENAKRIVNLLDSICDVVVVSFHGGAEGASNTHVNKKTEYFYGENRGNVHKFSHVVIDNGADIVFGHGPHVTRALEIYKDRLICYSLGNFCTYKRFNLSGVCGLAPIVEVNVNNKGKFISGNIISIKQIGSGIPVVDPEQKALSEIKKLISSDFPESKIVFNESSFTKKL
ncbi:MAG: capsule biosynthesis protein CapA [Crocinitomicaceae bacterium]|nr:capsule biosynthesis protein CapA [Crocinitomicaceae bacterium]|tara:strand:+ start:14174 stop:15205 length:1032 start_codon:yes stop_codon:yes gene_type:complete